jgi:competence protein ComEA
METEEIVARLLPMAKKYWLPLLLASLGLILFGYGLISLFINKQQSQDSFSQGLSQPSVASVTPTLITVDVEGSVVSPGVYKLSEGAIIQDALIAAKGLSEDADREQVSKNINLAQKLTDSQKIYVPKIGETVSQIQQQALGAQPSLQTTGLININTASAVDLDSLPGIGPVTAGKIINGRPYANINDLLSKKIVTSKVFGEIKDKIAAN